MHALGDAVAILRQLVEDGMSHCSSGFNTR
jgi:hypothetical protein